MRPAQQPFAKPKPRGPRRLSRRRLLTLTALGLSPGCAGHPAEARRITLETWLETGHGAAFENAHGFEVSLSSAELGIDHLYFVTGDPVGGSLSHGFWLRTAHAHPGHYSAGDTLGEMDEASQLDLLGDARRLDTSAGITGEARSCVLRFRELSGSDLAVRVAGKAVRGDRRVSFRAGARLSELLNSASDLPEVPGILLEGGPIEGDGRMHFAALPRFWLDQVDFAELVAGNEDEALEFEPDSQPHNAFVRGLLKAVAYRLKFEESP